MSSGAALAPFFVWELILFATYAFNALAMNSESELQRAGVLFAVCLLCGDVGAGWALMELCSALCARIADGWPWRGRKQLPVIPQQVDPVSDSAFEGQWQRVLRIRNCYLGTHCAWTFAFARCVGLRNFASALTSGAYSGRDASHAHRSSVNAAPDREAVFLPVPAGAAAGAGPVLLRARRNIEVGTLSRSAGRSAACMFLSPTRMCFPLCSPAAGSFITRAWSCFLHFLFNSFKIPLAALPLVPLPSLLGAVAVGLSNNALSSFAT